MIPIKKIPEEIIKDMAKLGLLAPTASQEYGGAGVDWTMAAIAAEELGLVNHILPVENFEADAEKFITEKLANNSAVVLQLTKRAFIEGATQNYTESIKKIEDIYLNELMKTNDANEGLAAFLEKRQPVWKNK